MPSPMKLRNPRLIRVVAFFAAWLVRLWTATLRIRQENRDDLDHPADAERLRFIYSFWHESLLSPVPFRKSVPLRVLISKHADGELISRTCEHLGVGVVRGSTTRGGSAALVELWDCSQRSHLVLTPDGPRGPRGKVQAGMIALASRSGLAIVPIGVGFSHAWRAKSWDRFAVPRPFSLCAFVAEKAIHVPASLDHEGLERFRGLVEERMRIATITARRLAGEAEVVDDGAGRTPHIGRTRKTKSKNGSAQRDG